MNLCEIRKSIEIFFLLFYNKYSQGGQTMKKGLLGLLCVFMISGCSTPQTSQETATIDDFSKIIEEYPKEVEDGFGNAFAYYDINGDNQEELIISDVLFNEDGSVQTVHTICQVYEIVDGKIEQVVEGWSRNRYTLCEDNYLVNEATTSAAEFDIFVYKLNLKGELEKQDADPYALKPMTITYQAMN